VSVLEHASTLHYPSFLCTATAGHCP
jgi:hypothetical protein